MHDRTRLTFLFQCIIELSRIFYFIALQDVVKYFRLLYRKMWSNILDQWVDFRDDEERKNGRSEGVIYPSFHFHVILSADSIQIAWNIVINDFDASKVFIATISSTHQQEVYISRKYNYVQELKALHSSTALFPPQMKASGEARIGEDGAWLSGR